MQRILLLFLLVVHVVLSAGCPDDDATVMAPDGPILEPPMYIYSAPEETMDLLPQAATWINEAAGCNLIGRAEYGMYVNEIIVVDSHYAGPQVAGCAWLNEATKRLDMPRHIEIVRSYLDDDTNVMLFAHEIGHTLGLVHTPEDVPGIMNPFISDTREWDPNSERKLEALCDVMDPDPEAPEELFVDRIR